MHMKTRRIALAAVMTALTVVFMYIASIIPSAKLAFAALACMCTVVVVAETGPAYALIPYFAAALISVTAAYPIGWLYAGFLGWYPSVKCIIERIKSRYLQWGVKVIIYIVSVSVLLYFVSSLAGMIFPKLSNQTTLLIAAGTVVMTVFDIVLSKFIEYYCGYLRPKFIKNR